MDEVVAFVVRHASWLSSLLATTVAGVFSLLVWLSAQRERARKRDHELFDWGSAVILVMSEIEGYAAAVGGDPALDRARLMQIKSRASGLVDQGRLFFLNVGQSREQRLDGAAAFKGTRVAILDEVVRAFLIAKHLCDHGPAADDVLRQQMRKARRRFVTHLQREMGRSLRRRSIDQAGQTVAKNPYDWPL